MKAALLSLFVVTGLKLIEGETSVIAGDPNQPVTLTCPLLISGDVVWNRTGRVITNSFKYAINSNNKTLTIQSIISPDDLGIYVCKILSYQENVILKSQPIMSKALKKALNLVEGDAMTLECNGYSFPAPSTGSWVKNGQIDVLLDDPRIDVDFSVTGLWGKEKLKIEYVQTDDQGDYICSLMSDVGQGNVTFRVRINSKLAPLWPIIGIVVEILLVIIIIVVLERKKAKVENKDN